MTFVVSLIINIWCKQPTFIAQSKCNEIFHDEIYCKILELIIIIITYTNIHCIPLQ